MTDKDSLALPKPLQKLARDFGDHGGSFCLADAALERWKHEFAGLPVDHRKPFAIGLVALAVKFRRAQGAQADNAVKQIIDLVAEVFGQGTAPGDLVERNAAARAEKVTGARSSGRGATALPGPTAGKPGRKRS
jgi:hypothetical protein